MVAGQRSAGSATQGTPTRNMGSGNSTDQSLNPQRSSRVTTPLWSTTLVSTPADSRRSLAAPGHTTATARKRPRQDSGCKWVGFGSENLARTRPEVHAGSGRVGSDMRNSCPNPNPVTRGSGWVGFGSGSGRGAELGWGKTAPNLKLPHPLGAVHVPITGSQSGLRVDPIRKQAARTRTRLEVGSCQVGSARVFWGRRLPEPDPEPDGSRVSPGSTRPIYILRQDTASPADFGVARSAPTSNEQHSGHQKTKEGNLQTLASASTQHDIAATTDSLASQGQTEAYDYDQDSEVEIEKIESKLCTKKGDEADEDDNFSYVEDCFEPPFWKSGDLPGTALNFNCKWCRVPYKLSDP
ncbi:hypothetical protein PSTG_15042 [Puccinia striiformis f. sp. tritici PST-78]|uniref:Uncharacterized protein n=1 Tax=Puccinia striiformis f. sp. tritici PST-78 TaxID=1165861 RepID=A0A0L0UX74_9BASI|nr:hypothetical protein PSTG_15042 [Puccinia striiformis f. sp. tritici PST-78]